MLERQTTSRDFLNEYGPGLDRSLLATLAHAFAEVSAARRVAGASVSNCVLNMTTCYFSRCCGSTIGISHLTNISIVLWHVCIDGDGVVLCSRSNDGHGEVVAEYMESCVVHLPRVSCDCLRLFILKRFLMGFQSFSTPVVSVFYWSLKANELVEHLQPDTHSRTCG